MELSQPLTSPANQLVLLGLNWQHVLIKCPFFVFVVVISASLKGHRWILHYSWKEQVVKNLENTLLKSDCFGIVPSCRVEALQSKHELGPIKNNFLFPNSKKATNPIQLRFFFFFLVANPNELFSKNFVIYSLKYLGQNLPMLKVYAIQGLFLSHRVSRF